MVTNYCGKSTVIQHIKNTLTNATIIALHDFYYLYVLKQYILLENLTSKKEYSSPESRVLFQLLNKILS